MIAKERNINLDLIRTIATILVVYIHCHEFVKMDSSILNQFLYYLGRCGVPLFLLITGSLVFDKKITIKKLINIYLISFFWCFFFNIINELFYNKNFLFENYNLIDLLKSSVKLNTSTKHLWYLKQILTLYILFFIKSKFDKITLPTSISLLILSMMYTSYLILFFSRPNAVPFIGLLLSTIGYLIYKKNFISNMKNYIVITLFILAFLLFLLTFNLINKFTADAWWYWNPFILTSSICIFKFLINIKINYGKKIFELISKNSFGIYLFHVFYISLFSKFIHINNKYFTLIILFIITFIISFLTSFCLNKTKLKKILW